MSAETSGPNPSKSDRLPGKRVSDSQATLSQRMQPEHANIMNNVHGGVLMKLIDEAGAISAQKHARSPGVVTVFVSSLEFKKPVHVGDLVTFSSQLTYVGTSSMETEVKVEAENMQTGEKTHTNSAYLVYVALDENKRPTQVPPLIIESEEERRRFEEGKKRQSARLGKIS